LKNRVTEIMEDEVTPDAKQFILKIAGDIRKQMIKVSDDLPAKVPPPPNYGGEGVPKFIAEDPFTEIMIEVPSECGRVEEEIFDVTPTD